MRFKIVFFHQMRCFQFYPFGIDFRHVARIQLGGFHQFRRHHPFGLGFEQIGGGEQMKAAATRTLVFVAVRRFQADLGNQACEQGAVYLVVTGLSATVLAHFVHGFVVYRVFALLEFGIWFVGFDAADAFARRTCFGQQFQFARGLFQLLVQFAPFAHARHAQEVLLQHLHGLLVGFLRARLQEKFPQIQIRQEIGFFVFEALVHFVGGIACFKWALARVLYRQGRHDNQDFRHTVQAFGREQHARDFRVDRQLGHLFTEFGEAVVVVYRTQFQQHLKTIVDVALLRRL